MKLNPNQLEFVQRYYHLLDTIEEGFEYVDDCYTQEVPEKADPMLGDIFTALDKVNDAHQQLQVVFQEDKQVLSAFEQFGAVISLLEEITTQRTYTMSKQKTICNKLIPAFVVWKLNVQQVLSRYVAH